MLKWIVTAIIGLIIGCVISEIDLRRKAKAKGLTTYSYLVEERKQKKDKINTNVKGNQS